MFSQNAFVADESTSYLLPPAYGAFLPANRQEYLSVNVRQRHPVLVDCEVHVAKQVFCKAEQAEALR